jgi:hypothetical protein
LFSRTRDIEDDTGACLRISLNAHPTGIIVTLERRDQGQSPAARLSLNGAEILSAFIMAARLAAPQALPDELAGPPCPTRFRLDCKEGARVLIEQDNRFPLCIEARLWDRLYAELCLLLAHGRVHTQPHTYYAVASLH